MKNKGSGGGSGSGDGGGSGGGDGPWYGDAWDKYTEFDWHDWVEVLIDRVERGIDKIARIAESAYKNITNKTNATFDEISAISNEISVQQQAYDRYIAQAEKVPLYEETKEKIRNGTLDIEQYEDEGMERVEEYTKWYEKALDCKDAIDELHESLAELYEDNFNNLQSNYENQLDMLEHSITASENAIDAIEERGYLASAKSYTALQELTRQNISLLNEELTSLTDAFNTAMASGEIEEGSESWYEMQIAIMDVQEQIDEANISLIEYENTMRKIEWDRFDFEQERIKQLTQESDFLIDLMKDSDLYDERGQLTDNGMATIGLHGMNYNVYMSQADKYANELLKINEELANDPNNTTLIERREELLGLQQDAILAAEDEKQAIKDLIEEGINVELDSLQELIDKYTDALDSAKDLYDYQKKIQDSTSEISDLQKQLLAYENNTSEETKATVQKLKASLKEAQDNLYEAEYEQYIEDQKKLLDDLYDEFEEALNQRLDNIDASFDEMIAAVNENSAAINETLNRIAADVGYTLTEGMQSIWSDAGDGTDSVIAVYGDGFNEKLTSINKVLDEINHYVSMMVASSDTIATSGTVAYANGGLADFTGLAKLDGTPQKPELVLNAEDTKNFLELKDVLRSMSASDITLANATGYNVGNVSHSGITDISSMVAAIRTPVQEDIANNFGDINVNIPIERVEDYNDFVNQLRSDKKFEQMIQSMTIDEIVGKSSLSKNKFKW